MRSEKEIIQRIGVLTAIIGKAQDELYDMALSGRARKCVWEINTLNKKIQRAYAELLYLQWVLGREEARL